MIDLVRVSRDPAELAREFERSAQANRNWVAEADRRDGRGEPKALPVDASLAGGEAEAFSRWSLCS